ncbi:MAG: hypothetical protein R6T91_07000 [Bacteroidales bacterium]
MKTIFTIFFVTMLILSGQAQDLERIQRRMNEVNNNIRNVEVQNARLLSSMSNLEASYQSFQDSITPILAENQRLIDSFKEDMKTHNNQIETIQKRLDETTKTLDAQVGELGHEQKTMKTIQYPGLIILLIIAVFIFIIMNRKLHRKHRKTQADLDAAKQEQENKHISLKKELTNRMNDLDKSNLQISKNIKELKTSFEQQLNELQKSYEDSVTKKIQTTTETFNEKHSSLEKLIKSHDKEQKAIKKQLKALDDSLKEE